MKSPFETMRKAIFRPLLIALSFLVPVQAHASCTSCFWSGYAVGCAECAVVVAALEGVIAASTGSIIAAINTSRLVTENKIDTATTAIVAAIEKSSAVNKELKQAELNYDAASKAGEAGAAAQDAFTKPSADLMDGAVAANACATMATATAATTAANNSAITARALTAADSRKALYTSNASGVMQQRLREYQTSFCSEQSRARGLCTTAVAAHMQDADTNAGSLLAPAGGRTYSEDESKAARQFIDNVVGPIPEESLPISLEKTEAGKRYVVEQRAMSSVRSMAVFSLNTIYSNNSAEDSSQGAAAANKVSIVGLMKKFVDERFGDPKYRDSLAKLGEEGLLRQIATSMAFQNWMGYQAYTQGERAESLLATSLALNARERTERSLGQLRAQAASLSK